MKIVKALLQVLAGAHQVNFYGADGGVTDPGDFPAAAPLNFFQDKNATQRFRHLFDGCQDMGVGFAAGDLLIGSRIGVGGFREGGGRLGGAGGGGHDFAPTKPVEAEIPASFEQP